MTTVGISPHVRNLRPPALLGDLPGWLMWRFEDSPGSIKPRKVPYYVDGSRRYGEQGSPSDRRRLTTFAAAASAAARRGMDGVGLALMPEWQITAVDFDHCVTAGAVLDDVLDAVAGTYAEYSPSGTGVRAFVTGTLGNGKSIGGQHAFGVELFTSTGYVTFTGNPLPITHELDCADIVGPPSSALQGLVQQRFSRSRERPEALPADPLGVPMETLREALDALPLDLPYDQWVQVGMALHHELGEGGFELWDDWSSRSPKYTSTDYGADRWDSFGRYSGPPVTVRTLVQLAREHGGQVTLGTPASIYEFDVLEPEPAAPPACQFPVLSMAEVLARPPLEYWIEDVLPRAELGVIYGESGSGKTFAVLDLVLAVQRGVQWRGLDTRQADVIYLGAEGSGGFGGRVRAYCDHHGIEPSDLGLRAILSQPNLLAVDDTRDLITSIREAGGCRLLVIDTLAQVIAGGNENSSEDMGKAVRHCRQITRTTGAMVLLVHHSGKDAARGARGWSGLRAACDVELEVIRDGDARTLHLSKLKDGEDGTRWGFNLNVVQVGTKADGKPLTSCVVLPAEAVAERPSRTNVGRVQQLVMRVLRDMLAFADEPVPYETLVENCIAQLPAGEGKRDRRRDVVTRALDGLAENCEIVVENMRVSLS
jgi:hypothetical protein